MQFSFIKYVQPGWYFNIKPKVNIFSTVYYHPNYLPVEDTNGIEEDVKYLTPTARYADMGFRLWNNGFLLSCTQQQATAIEQLPPPCLTDEYRFVCKYWGKHWAIMALVVRLLSLKNPFQEIKAFTKNLAVKRQPLHTNIKIYPAYQNFVSPLVAAQPKVSVIIPTLNRYKYLQDVMQDLEKQNWKNFEVIVIDQSENFNEAFYKQFALDIKVVQQKEKLLWTARNEAVKISNAKYLLFFDDDSRVEPDWIEHHMKTIDFFNADISAGVSLAVIGAKVPKSYSFFRWADQFDSGNALVKREVFEKIGLFDLQFNKERMGDGEFGLRAYVNGLKSISNPYAKRVHLKVPSGGLREIGHWDGFRPKKLFAPKPIPSVIYLYKKYFPKELYRNSVYLGIVLSNLSFKSKSSKILILVSVILTIVKLPLLAIQFNKSLKLANAKIKAGNKIEYLT